MFIVGLEGDLKLFFCYWKLVLIVVILGVIFLMVLVVLFCVGMFDFLLMILIFFGFILSVIFVSIIV